MYHSKILKLGLDSLGEYNNDAIYALPKSWFYDPYFLGYMEGVVSDDRSFNPIWVHCIGQKT